MFSACFFFVRGMQQTLYKTQKNQVKEKREVYTMSGFVNYIREITIFQKTMRNVILCRGIIKASKSKIISGINNQRINMEFYT